MFRSVSSFVQVHVRLTLVPRPNLRANGALFGGRLTEPISACSVTPLMSRVVRRQLSRGSMRVSIVPALSAAALLVVSAVVAGAGTPTSSRPAAASLGGVANRSTPAKPTSSGPVAPAYVFTLASMNPQTCIQGGPQPAGRPAGGTAPKKRHAGPLVDPCTPPGSLAPPRPHS